MACPDGEEFVVLRTYITVQQSTVAGCVLVVEGKKGLLTEFGRFEEGMVPARHPHLFPPGEHIPFSVGKLLI